MKIQNVKRHTLSFVVSLSFVASSISSSAWANENMPMAISPEGAAHVPAPQIKKPSVVGPAIGAAIIGGAVAPAAAAKQTMNVATVSDEYSCPLFDNKPHSELIAAIDALNKEVRISNECDNDPSAKSIQDNGKIIKDALGSMHSALENDNPADANSANIESTMTGALQAVSGLGDVLNNNAFLSSKCGRQTMSTGKALLAFNDVINGMVPYALFAVSMNAALAPALPFVIAGAVATSGISALSKMIDSNSLDMNNPQHRKAILQNTCQFTKVARKVRFMQLAQSGRIDTITRELQRDIDIYKSRFAAPSGQLNSLLSYRATATKNFTAIETQLASDRADLTTVQTQVAQNSDDLMVCTLSQELVNWTKDGKSFPASVVRNLQAATAQTADKSQRLEVMTMGALNANAVKKISELAPKASSDDNALRSCAATGRSWIKAIGQAVALTTTTLTNEKTSLENELGQNSEYRNWKIQYSKIQVQQVTATQVEKAMEELSKDDSVIDRSELAQRMVILKQGLFGSRKFWSLGKPPVLAWIEHTKDMHDQSVSAFINGMKAIRQGSWTLTPTAQGATVKISPGGMLYRDPKQNGNDLAAVRDLSNISLKTLPPGSDQNNMACQMLEGAWLDWSAAWDHLGAIKFFCDMIDPVLDVKMDASIVMACRGSLQFTGQTPRLSMVDGAKKMLAGNYQNDAALVSKKLKELMCPLPALTVMSEK